MAMYNKDHGFLVKNFDGKGWGLYDLQTSAVQMPVSGGAKIEQLERRLRRMPLGAQYMTYGRAR